MTKILQIIIDYKYTETILFWTILCSLAMLTIFCVTLMGIGFLQIIR